MCLLVCIFGRDGSLVIGANRDERYDRRTRAPFIWDTDPKILAGQDLQGGGTWLAVSTGGVVAAVTNRADEQGDDPVRPSRGGLPLLACRCPTGQDARGTLGEHLKSRRYNGFNLMVADADGAFVVESESGRVRIADVLPGVHVVANGGWNDETDPRVSRAFALLADLTTDVTLRKAPEPLVGAVMRVCRDSQPLEDGSALCFHGRSAGTVSSTIFSMDHRRRLTRYLHAPGPPCEADYRDIDVSGL